MLGVSSKDDSILTGRNRRRDIQGLRAFAVLMVVAFHAGLPVPGGFVGVDVFFVISGFVITSMLYREQVRYGRIRFGQFFFRRFKRLTPALALVVAATMIISIFVLSPFGSQQVVASTGIGAMLLTANFVIVRTTGGYFDGSAAMNLARSLVAGPGDLRVLVHPVWVGRLGWKWLEERIIHRKTLSGCCNASMNSWRRV